MQSFISKDNTSRLERAIIGLLISDRVDRASAAEKVDLGSIPNRAKPSTRKIGINRQARSQNLKKGETFLKEWKKMQSTLTQIFFVLESESLGLYDFGRFILKIETEILAKIGNSNAFSAQKAGDLKKNRKKQGLRRNSDEFFGQNWNNSPNTGDLQKKKSSPKLRRIFRPKLEIQTLFQAERRHLLHNFGTQFPLGGGCFYFFNKNQPQKHQKRAILHILQANGGLEPPSPPSMATLLFTAAFMLDVQH